MTIEESADRLRHLIAESGVATRADPVAIWTVFKRYAGESCAVPTRGYSFARGDGGGGRPAYFEFGRAFDDELCGEQVTASFRGPPGVLLGLRAECSTGGAADSLPAWFAAVEASPAFQAGVRYSGWSFEVVVYGLW